MCLFLISLNSEALLHQIENFDADAFNFETFYGPLNVGFIAAAALLELATVEVVSRLF